MCVMLSLLNEYDLTAKLPLCDLDDIGDESEAGPYLAKVIAMYAGWRAKHEWFTLKAWSYEVKWQGFTRHMRE